MNENEIKFVGIPVMNMTEMDGKFIAIIELPAKNIELYYKEFEPLEELPRQCSICKSWFTYPDTSCRC